VRGWFKPFPASSREEMHADEGRKLLVKLSRPGDGYRTDVGGFIYRESGWLYGNSHGRAWAVPESSVLAVVEI
jgi:hypothetical protein